jgi:hypothetical protein
MQKMSVRNSLTATLTIVFLRNAGSTKSFTKRWGYQIDVGLIHWRESKQLIKRNAKATNEQVSHHFGTHLLVKNFGTHSIFLYFLHSNCQNHPPKEKRKENQKENNILFTIQYLYGQIEIKGMQYCQFIVGWMTNFPPIGGTTSILSDLLHVSG